MGIKTKYVFNINHNYHTGKLRNSSIHSHILIFYMNKSYTFLLPISSPKSSTSLAILIHILLSEWPHFTQCLDDAFSFFPLLPLKNNTTMVILAHVLELRQGLQLGVELIGCRARVSTSSLHFAELLSDPYIHQWYLRVPGSTHLC